MNLSPLGLLLAVLLASSEETIAAGSDDLFHVEMQDEAISDPASVQSQKKNDPADNDTVLASPTTSRSLQSPSPTTNLRQHAQPMNVDRRLDGHSSSFAGHFIDGLLHQQDYLRHSTSTTSASVANPSKSEALTRNLLRGRTDLTDDDGRHLTVIETKVVGSNSDDPSIVGTLRNLIEAHNNAPPIDPSSGQYRLIIFDCPLLDAGNTIRLTSDLVITRPNLAIDATTDVDCRGGMTHSALSNIHLDGYMGVAPSITPTSAAPILHIQSEAHNIIYRGLRHDRVPVKIEGNGSRFSHNHFTDFDPVNNVDSLTYAITVLSSRNDFRFNTIGPSGGDQRTKNGMLFEGHGASSNFLYRNVIECETYGIRANNHAKVLISETRVLGTHDISHGVSITAPDEPIIHTAADGSVPALPLTCTPHGGYPENGGGVQLTVTSGTNPAFPVNTDYTIEIFSTDSATSQLDHFVAKAVGTSDSTGSVVRNFHIPCIIGDYLTATISTAEETSRISLDKTAGSNWASGCQCSGVFCSGGTTYCPFDSIRAPPGCKDLDADANHCDVCGFQCPNAQDYGHATKPVCSGDGSVFCGYEPSAVASDGTLLASFDFEALNEDYPGASCDGSAFFNPGLYYDKSRFRIEQNPRGNPATTSEIVVLDGKDPTSNDQIFNVLDPSVSGKYAIGMYSHGYVPFVGADPKIDTALIRFDASGFNHISVQANIAPASLPEGECVTQGPIHGVGTGNVQPVLHLVLADWPNAGEPFNWPLQQEPFDWGSISILDEGTVIGTPTAGSDLTNKPFTVDWSRRSLYLEASGATSGWVALLLNFEMSPQGAHYNLLDNLLITGSSAVLGGFNMIELEEGTQGNRAHYILSAGTSGTIGYSLKKEDCTTEETYVTASHGTGGSAATSGSYTSYIMGSDWRLDLHLDGLYVYFQTQSVSSYTICSIFTLDDQSGNRVNQRKVKAEISLGVVDQSFQVQVTADTNLISTQTLTKDNDIEGTLVDATGNPIVGSPSHSPGDTVSYKFSAPPGTVIGPLSVDVDLIAPTSTAAETTYPLVQDDLPVSPSSLNPGLAFAPDPREDATSAIGTVELTEDFVSDFSGQGFIVMTIDGSLTLGSARRARRRRLSDAEVLHEPQRFTVTFGVRIPKKERLSSSASGGIAVGIVVLLSGAFGIVAYMQSPRHSAHHNWPETKSTKTVETHATHTSASSKTDRSGIHPGNEVHTTSRAKSFRNSRSSKISCSTSSGSAAPHPSQMNVTEANDCTVASSATNTKSFGRDPYCRPARPARHYERPVDSVKIYPTAPRSHGSNRSSLTRSVEPDEMRHAAASSTRSHKSHRNHPSSRPNQPDQRVYTAALSSNTSHKAHRSHSSSRPVATVKIANCRQEV